MPQIHQDFRTGIELPLSPLEMGQGRVEARDGLNLVVEPTAPGAYSDGQIFDYHGLRYRRDFLNRPPLRMIVRAKASHDTESLIGTAGFGFWNQPYLPGSRSLRLPRAVWFFFASPHSNMAFARDVPGWGWKAATLDASRPPFFALAPGAPLGFLAMRVPALYRKLWPLAQWAIGAAERFLNVLLTDMHTYRLDWLLDRSDFYVDDQLVFMSPYSPRGPLGFVAWIDNQYAVVTPQGNFRMGFVPLEHQQSLFIDSLDIETL
ncbi:MAG TPA: hypothetical protein VKQ72_14715 [Aggregatilineales bacterium]|nr:hypothetical protein [Aggregatilineales bacterium]